MQPQAAKVWKNFRKWRLFLHESRFEIAMMNCNCDLNYQVYTHMRENTLPSLLFSIPRVGRRRNGSFLWFSDIIWDRIAIRNCHFFWRKWLEGHVAPPPPPPPNHNLEVKTFIPGFHCVIWEKGDSKILPDHHLNCTIQITLCGANTCRPVY